jgi:hypothetical protein
VTVLKSGLELARLGPIVAEADPTGAETGCWSIHIDRQEPRVDVAFIGLILAKRPKLYLHDNEAWKTSFALRHRHDFEGIYTGMHCRRNEEHQLSIFSSNPFSAAQKPISQKSFLNLTMKTCSIVVSVLSAVSAVYGYSVDINATTSGIDNPDGGFTIITADLYTLNTYNDLSVTALQLIDSSQFPPADVECRAYQDTHGFVPGSLPFSGHTQALLSTNTVQVGGITCYAINRIPGSK